MSKDLRPKQDQVIFLGGEPFITIETKVAGCAQCDAGDYCKEVYNRYHTANNVGCKNRIFKHERANEKKVS